MKMFFPLGRCMLVVLCLSAQTAFAADAATEPAMKSTFLVIYKPGPAWLTGKPLSEQPLKAHWNYMLSLYAKSCMRTAGPFTDDAGGAVVLEVADATEAQAIVSGDPAVTSGVFVYEVHPWKMVPWEKYVKKAG